MSGLEVFQVACSIVTLVACFHTIVWSRCTTWHLRNANLAYRDRPAYLRREKNPPWFVRYSNWLDRVVFRKPVQR